MRHTRLHAPRKMFPPEMPRCARIDAMLMLMRARAREEPLAFAAAIYMPRDVSPTREMLLICLCRAWYYAICLFVAAPLMLLLFYAVRWFAMPRLLRHYWYFVAVCLIVSPCFDAMFEELLMIRHWCLRCLLMLIFCASRGGADIAAPLIISRRCSFDAPCWLFRLPLMWYSLPAYLLFWCCLFSCLLAARFFASATLLFWWFLLFRCCFVAAISFFHYWCHWCHAAACLRFIYKDARWYTRCYVELTAHEAMPRERSTTGVVAFWFMLRHAFTDVLLIFPRSCLLYIVDAFEFTYAFAAPWAADIIISSFSSYDMLMKDMMADAIMFMLSAATPECPAMPWCWHRRCHAMLLLFQFCLRYVAMSLCWYLCYSW